MTIKPSKFVSIFGVISGIVCVFIGIYEIIPKFKVFGIIWILVSSIMTIYYGINLLTKKGLSLYTVDNISKNKKD